MDRLIDLEPNLSTEPAGNRFSTLEDLKASVRRDLEWLLNTRKMVTDVPEALEELKRSVVTYGVPDISGVHIEHKIESANLRTAIENSIRIFEPRFLDVTASMEPMSSTDRQLRFRIEATLDLDPVPEAMVFDTVMQLGSGAFAVNDTGSRG
ncbi:MAG: type VI secretion system baseplate subunit TssE [bacterium]|nr:type VI secretion system baseplate subunit TssE [bacterium]